jgi:hypothetical protein
MTALSSDVHRSVLKWLWVLAVAGLIACSKGDGGARDDSDSTPGGAGSNGANDGSDPSQPGGDPMAVPDDVGITKTDPCFTPEQSFAWELYGGVFSRCIGCHNDFGLARQAGVSLRLTFPGEPDFARKNVEILTSYAQAKVDVSGTAVPMLLAKPTARVSHTGGEVIAPDSAEARLLESFVAKLADPPQCKETPADAAEVALAGLTLAPPRATYARAKFILAGEVATPEELDALPDTEAMLDEQLDALMATPAFLGRVQEMFADWLLTDAYSTLVRGDDLLNQLRDYPQTSYFQPLCTPERDFRCCDPADGEVCCVNVEADPAVCTMEANDLAIDAMAREPLELIKLIVQNDLPMTELVTADYGIANPYSAMVYGLSEAQRSSLFDADRSNDATEFKPMLLTPTPQNALRMENGAGYPHAGVLSMPSLLVRYPSSASNQQRTRSARVVLERMLAIPVMKLSDFSTARLPADADLELATQQYPACTVCHAAIDPIAGHFQNFGSSGQYRTSGRGRLAEHLPDPSFLGTALAADAGDPLRALGAQVAQHPRFGLGVLMPVLADLIGTEILTPPSDMLAADYRARYLAFRIQQIEVQRLRREFSGPAGLRLKPLVKAIVKGAFFRAVGAPAVDEVTAEALAIAGVGVGALLTPEQMARKIESVTGLTLRSGNDPTGRDMFRSFREYRLMFGGTDWDATPQRYREPNAMAVRIAMRTGNSVACLAVPQDFAVIDPAARRLFPNVDLDTTPDNGGEAAIRQEIRRLHRLLLGEELPEGHAELEASYQLWVQSRDALQGGNSQRMQCRATESASVADTPYPTATHRVVDADPNATVRPWMAVVAYLISDGRFFLQ